jgi:hypothetical protein
MLVALEKGFVVFVILGVIWLTGVVAFTLVLALPSIMPDNQSVELSYFESVAIVLLWPATLVVVLLGVNKFVRDEYES